MNKVYLQVGKTFYAITDSSDTEEMYMLISEGEYVNILNESCSVFGEWIIVKDATKISKEEFEAICGNEKLTIASNIFFREEHPKIGVGALFKCSGSAFSNETYRLIQVSVEEVCLVNTSKFSRWTSSFKVGKMDCLSGEEIGKMYGGTGREYLKFIGYAEGYGKQ